VAPDVNVSNTFFSGYQTLFFSTPNFQYDPWTPANGSPTTASTVWG